MSSDGVRKQVYRRLGRRLEGYLRLCFRSCCQAPRDDYVDSRVEG